MYYAQVGETLKFTGGGWDRAETAICHAEACHMCYRCILYKEETWIQFRIYGEIENVKSWKLKTMQMQTTHAFLKPSNPFYFAFSFSCMWSISARKFSVLLQQMPKGCSRKKRPSFNARSVALELWRDAKMNPGFGWLNRTQFDRRIKSAMQFCSLLKVKVFFWRKCEKDGVEVIASRASLFLNNRERFENNCLIYKTNNASFYPIISSWK